MSANHAEAALLHAREEGHKAGLAEARSAVDCPYTHGALPLRTAWLTGFGEGRIAREPIPSRNRNQDVGPALHTG